MFHLWFQPQYSFLLDIVREAEKMYLGVRPKMAVILIPPPWLRWRTHIKNGFSSGRSSNQNFIKGKNLRKKYDPRRSSGVGGGGTQTFFYVCLPLLVAFLLELSFSTLLFLLGLF